MEENNIGQSNTSPNNKPKKPIYKRPWFIVIAAIFAFGIIDSTLTDSGSKSVDNSSAVAEADIKSSTEKETVLPTEEPTEVKTEPPTEKPTEAEIDEKEEGFIDGAKKFLFGNDEENGAIDNIKNKAKELIDGDEDGDGIIDKVKDKAKEFFSDEEIGVTIPDEFMFDGTLYSINELTVDEAKGLVTDAKEKKDSNGNLTSLQNDNIVIEFDQDLGEVSLVSFLSSGNKIYNDVEVGMSKRKVIERYGSPITLDEDESQLLWYFDSNGNQVFSMKNAVCFMIITTDWLNNVKTITIANETMCHLFSQRYGW